MNLLTDANRVVFAYDKYIEYGYFEDDCYKWKISSDDTVRLYVLDPNWDATVEDECVFKRYEVEAIPDDMQPIKYLYIDGAFVENPDWVEPPKTDSERIADLEALLAEQKEQLRQVDDTAIELYEMQLAQEEINQIQDDALIELYEMLEA